MKLISIGAFVLVVMSVASLISGGQSSQLLQQSWSRAETALPQSTINEFESAVPAYAQWVLRLLPPQFREKVSDRMWAVIELVIFRLLLAWHLGPAFLLAGVVGFLEGSWARSTQKDLVKIHSPMRFSAAMAGLGLTPVAILLWATAPIMAPVIAIVTFVPTLEVFSIRNLIVHAPTQF